MRVEVIRGLDAGGRRYEPGEIIELDDQTVRWLERVGAVRVLEEQPRGRRKRRGS